MAALKNRFAWSTRRGNVFDECPRRYWFEYYGHWGGWNPRSDDRTREIYILKQLKSRQAWVGARVHDAISDALQLIHARLAAEPETVAEEVVQAMRADFRESQAKAYRDRPKKACGLIEHEFDIPVPKSEWGDLAEHARACVRNFFESPPLAQLRDLDRERWLEVEELDEFLVDGVPVYVKLDLAYRPEASKLVILDWKTGKHDPQPDPIQLACYSIYAMGKWGAAPAEIENVLYNLPTRSTVSRTVDEELIRATRERIHDSIQAMLTQVVDRDPDRNEPLPEEAFAVTDSPAVCRRCPFRRVCPDSPLHRE